MSGMFANPPIDITKVIRKIINSPKIPNNIDDPKNFKSSTVIGKKVLARYLKTNRGLMFFLIENSLTNPQRISGIANPKAKMKINSTGIPINPPYGMKQIKAAQITIAKSIKSQITQ